MSAKVPFIGDGEIGLPDRKWMAFEELEKGEFTVLDDADGVVLKLPASGRPAVRIMEKALRYLASRAGVALLVPTESRDAKPPARRKSRRGAALADAKKALQRAVYEVSGHVLEETEPEVWRPPTCWFAVIQGFVTRQSPAKGFLLRQPLSPRDLPSHLGARVSAKAMQAWLHSRPLALGSFGSSGPTCACALIEERVPSESRQASVWAFLPVTAPQLGQDDVDALEVTAVLLGAMARSVEEVWPQLNDMGAEAAQAKLDEFAIQACSDLDVVKRKGGLKVPAGAGRSEGTKNLSQNLMLLRQNSRLNQRSAHASCTSPR